MPESKNPAREKYRPLLSAYVDGELSPGERREVEQHLANNPVSAQEVADLRAASGLMRVALDIEADDVDWKVFTGEVMGKVAPQRLPFLEGLGVTLSELFTYQRGPMVAAFAGAALALLVAVPVLVNLGRVPEGYAATQLVVERVTVDEAAQVKPVVMETESGDAIIWMVEPQANPKKDGGKKDDESQEEELLRAAPHPTAEPL